MYKFLRARRLWLVGCIACVLFGAAQAQSDVRRGFVYEVRKGNQSALLLGTIHVGRPEFYPLPAATLGRIEHADAIVLEADVTDTGRAIAATQKYAVYGASEPGLDTRLPPALKARIETIAERNQLETTPLWRMKPWMLGNVLALFEAAQAGYMPALSVEAYLTRIAKQNSKPVLELESIEQQFELFERAPFRQRRSRSSKMPSRRSRPMERDAKINRIAQAWETGDAAALDRLMAEMRAQTSVGARFTVSTILYR